MSLNPLRRLAALGQSVWYDYIRRDLIRGPELRRLIAEDAVTGMTSNPTIFERAIAATTLYDGDIRHLAESGASPVAILESLAVQDVCHAADVFRPIYESTGGDDGFVSIEVAPRLARDTEGSVAEARRLWKACGRPNVMVKIPATEEGVPAIRRCLSEGININVTLLFSVSRYREVMEAYLAAMAERVEAGRPVDRIRSVASFFVSRVDTNASAKLDAVAIDSRRSESERRWARGMRGKVAIANARRAYQAFEEVLQGPRFARLAGKGVHTQRPLWASTSAKDPAYPDLYYVEALIAPRSVDTMPPATLRTYRDEGHPRIRIHDDLPGAKATLDALRELGIDPRQLADELEDEGVRKFLASYDGMLGAVEGKARMLIGA